MNTIKITNKNTTTHDVFDSIMLHYCYPTNMLSQDAIHRDYIMFLELIEQFFDSATKPSALQPFIFDRSLEGITLKKENPLGKLFYKLLVINNNFIDKNINLFIFYKNYELSEKANILLELASHLKFNEIIFTNNPITQSNNEGLREGDLINTFVSRLREASEKKYFKTKVAQRKKNSTQYFKKTKSFIDSFNTEQVDIYGIHVVLCYQTEPAKNMTLDRSADHINKFIKELSTDLTPNSPIGWWWKREYVTEISYCYHLIIFFNVKKITSNLETLQDYYCNYWNIATANQGIYFRPLIKNIDPQNQPQIYFNGLDWLLLQMKNMLMRDIFMRLKSTKNITHFDMGKLPVFNDTTSTNNNNMTNTSSHFNTNI